MSGRLKELLSSDVRDLIKHLSGFEEGEANFDSCERFIFSHILYHKYLSVDSHAVRRSVDGVILKLDVHGLSDKARRLETIVQKFLLLHDKDTGSQVDIQWCLLSLLLHLANNPSGTPLTEEPSDPLPSEDADVTVIDWKNYLLEGCEEYQHDWDALSDLEDSLEEVPPHTQPSCQLSPPISSVSCLSATLQSNEDTKQPKCLRIIDQLLTSETWLTTIIQNTWWMKATHHTPLSAHLAANSAFLLDTLGKSGAEVSTVSEHKAVLEIIWMLSSPSDSYLFMKVISDDGKRKKFCVRPHVTIPSLCESVFDSLLSSICRFAEMIRTLKDFSYNLYHSKSQEKFPFTYQAYDIALQSELQSLFEEVSKLEQDVHKRGRTFTILSVMKLLQPWLSKLEYLHYLHRCAVLDCEKHPNWLCATHLFSVLLSCLQKTEEAGTVFRIFMKTFKVYLDILDTWYSEGQLLDWRNEFLVSRCENADGLLGASFEKRNWESEISALGVKCPKVLFLLADYALKAAQPLHVLHRMNRLAELQRQNTSRGGLYSWFLNDIMSSVENSHPHISSINDHPRTSNTMEMSWWMQIDRLLPISKADIPEPISGEIEGPRNISLKVDWIMNHLSRLEDPLLHENFASFSVMPVDHKLTSSPSSMQDENHSKLDKLSTDLPELPLEWFVEKALIGLPAFSGSIAGSMVADILMTEQRLLLHVKNIHSVCMMCSGHKLQPFVSHIFKLVAQRRNLGSIDAPSLTVLLQDCMDSDNFFISVLEVNDSLKNISALDCIDCVCVTYQMDWPLCAIFGGDCEVTYNFIFHLLLKLRWGLWNLEHISLRGSAKSLNPLSKRLFLLRFQLLHVIQSVYNFLCVHTLGALCTQFYETLKSADNLHAIVRSQSKFLLDVICKSLRADTPDAVKNAFFQLVVLAENLYLLWKTDNSNINSSKLSNMEACYSDCHTFLGLALRTLVQEEGQRHLALLSDLINWNIPNCRND